MGASFLVLWPYCKSTTFRNPEDGVSLLVGLHLGDEAVGYLALALLLYIEIADGGEHHCADEIHQQILHGVDNAQIQIAAQAQGLLGAVGVNHDGIHNILDVDNGIAAGGVQVHRIDDVNHGILLHIHAQKLVHTEFIELPQHPHRHGKAEGNNGQIQRRELEGKLVVPVQHVHQAEADGGAKEAVDGVQHGIPIGNADIEAVDFP